MDTTLLVGLLALGLSLVAVVLVTIKNGSATTSVAHVLHDTEQPGGPGSPVQMGRRR